MDTRSIPLVPLHLTALAILSPSNAPLFVHSFTGKQDELRHYHLAHAAVDVIEERSGSDHEYTYISADSRLSRHDFDAVETSRVVPRPAVLYGGHGFVGPSCRPR